MATKDLTRPLPELSELDIKRFWSKVDKSGGADACWEWMGGISKTGYGQFKASGRTLGAHRVASCLGEGVDPYPLLACHKCDNRSCCRPDHLFAGTTKDNLDDMRNKGRGATGDKNGSRKHPEQRLRGEEFWAATLTASQVIEIRRLSASGMNASEIARKLGVSAQAAYKAIVRRTWKHIS